MTIKQQGGIFGRNPTFSDVNVSSLSLTNSSPLIELIDADDTDQVAQLSGVFGHVDINADVNNARGGSRITFNIDGSEVGRWNDTGNLVIANSGNGIDFSATSGTGTSELFDDYEEGTWTPTVTSGSGTLTTVTVSEALYTKIGREVTVYTKFVLTDAGTGSSSLIVDGFPYTINSDYANGVAMGRNVVNAKLIFGQLSGGNSKVTLIRNYDNTDPITNGHTYALTANYSV